MTSSSVKKIIIIGASSGIGRELARRYAIAGHQLCITGRRGQLLQTFAAEHSGVLTRSFDVTSGRNQQEFNAMVQQLGGLDLFIYNAGYGEVSETLDWQVDKKMVDLNVNGFVEMANLAWQYFAAQGHGQIVGVSSIASIRGNALAPAYSASKAFMSTYLEGLSIRSRKKKLGIVVTDIQPGFVDTKPAASKRFWVSTTEKACNQIFKAIAKRKRRAYVTRRWAWVAWLMKRIPYALYSRI